MAVQLSRRALLGALTSAVACSSAPRSRSVQPAPVTHADARAKVVVLGGGLAGLTAALELVERGHEVHVLEARHRPGGRILTLREPFSAPLYVEAGAKHVVPDPDLLALMARVGVQVVPAQRPPRLASVTLLGGVRRVRGPDDESESPSAMHPTESALAFPERLTHYFPNPDGLSPHQAGWQSARRELDNITAAAFLQSRGASPAYVKWLDESIVPGDGIETASALSIAREAASIRREIALTEKSGQGGGRVAGGSDRLPSALAERLGQRVRYGAVVRHFEADANRVRVVFDDGRGRAELTGDRLICAIPYSVLRTVSRPRFSAAKERAIESQRMASVLRVWAEYRQRPWRERGESGQADSDLSVGMIQDELGGREGPTGILTSYMTRQTARDGCALSESGRIDRFLADVERIHPGSRAHFVGAASQCWDSDPYARGAYAWFAPGELSEDEHHLPEGRIHFAGDHTSHRPGFMHGAVASALRVVNELTLGAEGQGKHVR